MLVAQTSERVGLLPQAVEKDWWVTMTLKVLFELSYRDFITFKGGTSLSKGWHVIERFLEDIDLAIDKSFWGITGGEQVAMGSDPETFAGLYWAGTRCRNAGAVGGVRSIGF